MIKYPKYQTYAKNKIVKKPKVIKKNVVIKNKKDCVIIKHREYVLDVVSAPTVNTFQNLPLSINPALQAMYPCGSNIMANFEEYKIINQKYIYKPISGNALTSANTALGYVILVTNYNPASSAFTNKSDAENYNGANSGVPSEKFVHYLKSQNDNNKGFPRLYTRSSGIPNNTSIQLYDLGVLNIITGGCQGTSVVLGELHIEYEIELYNMKIARTLGNSIFKNLSFHAYATSGATGITPGSNYFGNYIVSDTSNLNAIITSNTRITLPKYQYGNYMISYNLISSISNAVSGITITPVEGQVLNVCNNNSQNYWFANSTGVNYQFIAYFTSATSGGLILDFTGGTFANIVSFDLYITAVAFNN